MLGFLNTIVLVGLFGVGLPVLIHLFARQKLQRITFSSTEFLKRIQNQKMRRVKLRQILLLILRCLVLFLVVVAFARPTLRKSAGVGKGRASSSIVLVVDRSLSMGRSRLFQQAQEWAASVLYLLRGEDEAALIWTPLRRQMHPEFTHNGYGLEKVILNEEVTWGRGFVLKSLGEAASILSNSHHINREIYLITDLQSTGFSSTQDTSLVPSWDGKLFVLPVVGEVENVAVVGGGVENQILQPGIPLRIFAEIKNCGDRRVENLLVRIFLEGRAAMQKTVSIEAGAAQRTSFRVIPERRGWIWGSIRVEEDDLPQDNEWFFICWIPERIEVLLVGKSEEDIHSIQLALETYNKNGKIFDVKQAFFGEDWIGQINGMNVVFLSNYPSFHSGEANRLKKFVEDGGGVFFFMGDDVDLRNMNEYFFIPILGITLGNVVGGGGREEGYLSFGSVDFAHPLFSGVFEKGKENIRSSRLFRVVEVMGNVPNKIITLGDGKPFLVETSINQGNVLIATGGIGDKWSDLPFSTLFAPLITRSAAYLSSPFLSEERGRTVGESASLSTGAEDINATYRVEDPSGEEILVLPEIREGRVMLHLTQADEPGIYRFYRGETLLGMEAVNIDAQESDLHPISEEDLEKKFPEARLEVVRDAAELDTQVSKARWGRELWREIILLALLVLVIEMLVSRESKVT